MEVFIKLLETIEKGSIDNQITITNVDLFIKAWKREAESLQLRKADVSGSPSFKEQLLNDFIPRVEAMKEKERLHLHWLIDNEAPLDFIQLSQKYYNHFSQRIKEYHEYAERL